MKKHLLISLFVVAALSVLPVKAETVTVLSINNSLIDYNSQDQMFNNMAAAMGKDASWTKHTNLGKTLEYHYYSDPLTPNAQAVVANTAWAFIILQEQSSLPLNNFTQFHTNVATWVTYIRANCPNPDVTIILPVNWPFSNDANYQTSKSTLLANYRSVADELGLTLCPVGLAYGNYQLDHPATFAADLYTDDRHPTQAATYLACCLEYAVIFGEDPSTITFKPGAVSEEMAQTLRAYAKEAYEGVERTEPIPMEETPAISIADETPYMQNFDIIGGDDVDPSNQEKTAFVRDTQLPMGWRIENNTGSCRTVLSYYSASETTMYIGGQSLASNAKNGTWNFGLTGSTDRAIGGITSSISGGARTISVMAKLHNDAGVDFTSLALGYDIEKYRNGSNAAGFVVQVYTSADGENWTSAGADFCNTYTPDAATAGAAVVPIVNTHVEDTLQCPFAADEDLYIAWSISVASGTDCAGSMAFGIDNVTITPQRVIEVPEYAVMLTDNSTITENFDVLGGADADPSTDAKTGVLRESTLPAGWKIERNMSAPRTIGAFASAAETTMYIGGQSLASNAYNGTWNFGATGSTDRAIGGLTTGIDNGTRGLTVMVRLYNNSEWNFNKIDLAYDIEKYRNGSNAAGFTVQLYTSSNGVNWTSAGETFRATYTPDANNNGFAAVPADTKVMSGELAVNFPKNSDLYLGWHISVSSGTSCNAALGLAIDNVSITPSGQQTPSGIEMPGEPATKSRKIIQDGHVFILHGEKMYTVFGAQVQ